MGGGGGTRRDAGTSDTGTADPDASAANTRIEGTVAEITTLPRTLPAHTVPLMGWSVQPLLDLTVPAVVTDRVGHFAITATPDMQGIAAVRAQSNDGRQCAIGQSQDSRDRANTGVVALSTARLETAAAIANITVDPVRAHLALELEDGTGARAPEVNVTVTSPLAANTLYDTAGGSFAVVAASGPQGMALVLNLDPGLTPTTISLTLSRAGRLRMARAYVSRGCVTFLRLVAP